MFKSNVKGYIKSTITTSQGVGSTFLVSNDFELDQPINTLGETVSLVVKTGTQLERMEVSMANGVATIVRRGIDQDNGVSTSLQKLWNDGTIFYLTALSFDLLDANDDMQILDGKKLALGADAYITTDNDGADLKFKDGSNGVVTLSEITAGTGTDHKLLVSADDTTANYLDNKITVSGDLVKTVTNPSGNESINIAYTPDVSIGMTGEIRIWTTGTAPTNWLICDGSSLLRASYANLFSVIGTTYGSVDGTHFNLPDLKGKVIVGFNSSETEFDTLGEIGGEKTHTLIINEIPAHHHSVPGGISGSGTTTSQQGYYNDRSLNTGDTGGGLAHNNLQPYITLNYIIRI